MSETSDVQREDAAHEAWAEDHHVVQVATMGDAPQALRYLADLLELAGGMLLGLWNLGHDDDGRLTLQAVYTTDPGQFGRHIAGGES